MTKHASSLEAILEACADGILVTDLEGKVEACNQAFWKGLNLVRRPQHISEADLPQLEVLEKRVLENGREIELSCRARIDQNEVTGFVWTLRERLEPRFDRETTELEENLRAITELIPQLVFICDRDGVNTYFNQQWASYTGLSLEESHGHGWSKAFHEDDRGTGTHTKSKPVPYQTECRIRRSDGEYRWHLIRGFPIFQETDEVARWIGTCTDIHDLKAAEESLRDHTEALIQARDKALEATRIKSEFLANMSHEIRTPLNGVIGMTSLLLETPLLPYQLDYMRTVAHSAESLMSVINDVLDFSKIEASKFEIEAQTFDLRTCIEELTELMAARVRDKKIELNCYIPSEFPESVIGDGARIRQVCANLIGNAVKFTEVGEVKVSVQLVSQLEGSMRVRIEVTDTGIGIPIERCGQIFESFTQADGSMSRRFGGTGLGLTLVKKITELLGGELGVSSEVGVGSCFWIELPLLRADCQAILVLPEVWPRPSCLIFTELDTTRKVLAEKLCHWGCSVLEARDREDIENWFDHTRSGQTIAFVDTNLLEQCIDIFRRIDLGRSSVVALESMGAPEYIHQVDGQSILRLSKPIRHAALLQTVQVALGRKSEQNLCTKPRQSQLGLKVLVAEDNSVNALIIQRYLSSLSCEHICVPNGAEALAKLRSESFDLVLMDVQMPLMDGVEATKQIRQFEDKFVCQITIIALTAHAQETDRQRCLDAGMNDYLSKPLLKSDLEAKLEIWSRRCQELRLKNAA